MIATAINAFATDLYPKLAAQEGNLAFSPASLTLALGMAYAGMSGESAHAMQKVLHLEGGRRAHEALADLQKNLHAADEGGATLQFANRLWPRMGATCNPAFLQLLRTAYAAEPHALDYAANPEGARRTINAWVSAQTLARVPELLPKGALGADTSLVLTNAIYFKGSWQEPFADQETRPEAFYADDHATYIVSTMHAARAMRYAESPEHQAVELLYRQIGSATLSMVLLVPRSRLGLKALERRITHVGLHGLTSDLRAARVDLKLPRFTFRKSTELLKQLELLGMQREIGACEASRIDAVFHECFVLVDEEGTEAAAATAVSVAVEGQSEVSRPPVVVRADHPFVFAVRDTRSGAILFVGRVTDPR